MTTMTTRNVSFSSRSAQSHLSLLPFLSTKWSNYALEVWSPAESVVLHLELHNAWSDENFVWFKRLPLDSVKELGRRKVGTTEWSDNAIVAKAIEIVSSGAPYPSKHWHILSSDQQSFVEVLGREITTVSPPSMAPPPLKIHRGMDGLKTWNRDGPPIAYSSQSGEDAISDAWTGGKGMLWAYPGGPVAKKKARG